MRFHKLDLNLLAVLHVLLDHQNVSRAAEQLNLTQPTISNALARLREHYRDELLVTSGRRMMLTPLAERLRGPIAEVLGTLRDIALARVEFDPATCDRTIVIACSDYVAEVLLAEVARRIGVSAPNVTLAVMPIGTRTLDGMARGTVDLVIMPEIVSEAANGDVRLSVDRCVPVVWQGNARCPDPMSLEHYLAASHILADVADTGGQDVISHFFGDVGHRPRIGLRVPNFSMAAQFVVGTLHVATIPAAMARRKVKELPLRIVKPDFDPPALNEMLRWPRRLDGDPFNIWVRDTVSTVAREVFGPVDDTVWQAGKAKRTSMLPSRL